MQVEREKRDSPEFEIYDITGDSKLVNVTSINDEGRVILPVTLILPVRSINK